MSSPNRIRIKELDLELIKPNTQSLRDGYKGVERGGSKIVVIGKPGCFIKGTPVMKYDGSIANIEDIKTGDVLMGDDSTPRNVMELCRNNDEMFKIVPKSGEPYTVNRLHKLVLKSCGYGSMYNKGDIIEITVEDFLKKSEDWKSIWAVFRTGVDFPSKPVELDPYILGLWLGDRTSASAEVDSEVINSLEEFCKSHENLYITNNSTIRYTIHSKEGTKNKNHLLNCFRKLNLIKNKHVPHVYKTNDRKTRLELLAGILDADGSLDVRGCCYDFIQKSESIANDVVYISRSLCLTATKKECIKSCMYKGEKQAGTYHRVTISGNINEIPCRIVRKQSAPRKCNRDNLVSRFSIEPMGVDDYYGFTLDGNHRFLLGTFDVVRNTGKTTLIKSLLYSKKHIIPVAMVQSGSEEGTGSYAEFIPDTFIYNDYEEQKVTDFVERQKYAREYLPNPWACLILDDCTDEPKVLNTGLQRGLFKRGRHMGLLYILSLQYALDLKPGTRVCIDGTFILKENNLQIRKKLFDNYASVIGDFGLFCQIMDQITGDYTALYIHNSGQSNDWRDCVFYYKPPRIPSSFKFGAKDYWNFHKARYDSNFKEGLF